MALRKHSGYYPPAGSVEVANDHTWRWDGRRWLHNGRVDYPANRPLRGVANGPLNGWFYDWSQKAWMEPIGGSGSSPSPIVRLPPRPTPAPTLTPTPATQQHKEEHMHKCEHHHHKPTLYEGIKDHPWVPVIGLLLMIGADFMQQPQPPVIPDGLPDNVGKQWQMIYNQNLQMYQTRRAQLDKYGGILLALGLGNAAVAEQGKDFLAALRANDHQAPAQASAATAHAGRAAM
jgi:hypothetical protein